jgi:hypothetical protein
MKRVLLSLTIVLLVFFSTLFSNVQYNPDEIVLVPPLDSIVSVDFTVNRPSGSVFYSGEVIEFSFRTNVDAYVAIVEVQSDGTLQLLFPNAYDTDNFVIGNRQYTLPTDNATLSYRFLIGPETGRNVIFAFASTDPLYFIDPAVTRFHQNAFPLLFDRISDFSSIVTSSLERTQWNLSTYYYYANYNPRLISTTIRSDRTQTRVFVDGVFAGIAPVNINLEPGWRRFYLFDNRDLAFGPEWMNVQQDSRRFDLVLEPTYPYGFLEVVSVPEGSVYVDGSYVGTTPYRDFARVGERSVRVTSSGYHSKTETVFVNEGITNRYEFRLEQKTEEEIRRERTILFSILGAIVVVLLLLALLL